MNDKIVLLQLQEKVNEMFYCYEIVSPISIM